MPRLEGMTIPEQPPSEAAFFTAIRRWNIVRGPKGLIGGVAAGLGERIGLAPWPTRLLIVVVAILLFPIVMIGYATGWALLPDAEGNIVIQNFGRGVTNVGALIGIGIFALVGFLSFNDLRPFGHAWFGPDISSIDSGTPVRVLMVLFALLIPLAVVAGVVFLIVYLARRTSNAGADAQDGAVYALTPAQARAQADGTAAPATTSATPVISGYAQPPAPRTPKPVPPRVPGPGRGFYLTLAGWTLLSIAGTAWAGREGLLGIYPALAWGMVFMTGLGVILVAVSLSGRRQGFMGFLGVVAVLIASLLLVRHGDLNEWWDTKQYVQQQFDEFPALTPTDMTNEFSPDYGQVQFGNSTCWHEGDVRYDDSGTTDLVTVPDPLDDDVAVDVLASVTTVVMPHGTSVTLTPDGWAQATVYFVNRNLVCHFPGDTGDYFLLTNPGDPVVELTVIDDSLANTIIIEEN